MLSVTSSSSRSACPACGAAVAHVKVPGQGWIMGEWPPAAPVARFRDYIVAFEGDFSGSEGSRAEAMRFEGFRLPGPTAAVLLCEHRCTAERPEGPEGTARDLS